MTTPKWAEERAREIAHQMPVSCSVLPSGRHSAGCEDWTTMIAAALIEAEAQGREVYAEADKESERLCNERHEADRLAIEKARAEGERAGLAGVDALLEACDDFAAHLFNVHNLLITESFAEAILLSRKSVEKWDWGRVVKIHADDCPALCHWPCAAEHVGKRWSQPCGHTDHDCTCTAQADLAELVAAAEREVQKGRNSDRLDAALKPFREKKPICGCDAKMHVCGTP